MGVTVDVVETLSSLLLIMLTRFPTTAYNKHIQQKMDALEKKIIVQDAAEKNLFSLFPLEHKSDVMGSERREVGVR